ncbi:MAG: DUF2189 domain-containing protein [Pseudomonadota bacterium]
MALTRGWDDFRAAPQYGIGFGAIFAIGGLLLTYFLFARGELMWLFLAAAGFPLLAPFTAVGLYEVSRRRELNIALNWAGVLRAIIGRDDDQILSMGVIIFVAFSFWVIIAHLVFAIFLAEAGAGSESLEFLISPTGLTMLATGSVIGAAIAFVFFAFTVLSLPLLVDRKVDFITAIVTSLRACRNNLYVLLVWALGIATSLFAALALGFVGLLVVLPVLSHATWHLYRRTVQHRT